MNEEALLKFSQCTTFDEFNENFPDGYFLLLNSNGVKFYVSVEKQMYTNLFVVNIKTSPKNDPKSKLFAVAIDGYHSNFFMTFIQYFKKVLPAIDSNNVITLQNSFIDLTVINCGNIVYNSGQKALKFASKYCTKTVSEANLVKYLIHYSGLYNGYSNRELDVIVKDHLKKFNNVDFKNLTEEQLYKYIAPALTNLNLFEIDTLKDLDLLSFRLANRQNLNVDRFKLLYIIALLKDGNNVEKDKALKDYDVTKLSRDNVVIITSDFYRVDFSSKKLFDFVKNLTFSEYYDVLVKNMDKGVSGDLIVEMFEAVKNGEYSAASYNNTTKIYYSVLSSLVSLKTVMPDYSYKYEHNCNNLLNATENYTLKFIDNCLSYGVKHGWNNNICRVAFTILEDLNKLDKVASSNNRNFIMFKLSKLLTLEELALLLDNVISYDGVIAVKQWLQYMDNVDEYKTLPVSWWVELV